MNSRWFGIQVGLLSMLLTVSGCSESVPSAPTPPETIEYIVHERLCDPDSWDQKTFDEACGSQDSRDAGLKSIRIDQTSRVATLDDVTILSLGDQTKIENCTVEDSANWRCDMSSDRERVTFEMVKGQYRATKRYGSGLAPDYWTGNVTRGSAVGLVLEPKNHGTSDSKRILVVTVLALATPASGASAKVQLYGTYTSASACEAAKKSYLDRDPTVFAAPGVDFACVLDALVPSDSRQVQITTNP